MYFSSDIFFVIKACIRIIFYNIILARLMTYKEVK